MPLFAAYQGLPFFDQALHGLHFMLCAFAILVAFIPMLTPKGSAEHKFGGMIYVPVSMAALLLASWMAWREQSLVLFCFNGFCAYLLASGWRAVHEKEIPAPIDWIIPGALAAVSVFVTLHALFVDEGRRSLYLLFFALNAFYLAGRDWGHLKRRAQWLKYKIFFANQNLGKPLDWLNRHVAGMVGSVIANLSVIALTLLPLSLHWLWPVTLALMGAFIALRERARKRRVRASMAVFMPRYVPASARGKDEPRRAA